MIMSRTGSQDTRPIMAGADFDLCRICSQCILGFVDRVSGGVCLSTTCSGILDISRTGCTALM